MYILKIVLYCPAFRNQRKWWGTPCRQMWRAGWSCWRGISAVLPRQPSWGPCSHSCLYCQWQPDEEGSWWWRPQYGICPWQSSQLPWRKVTSQKQGYIHQQHCWSAFALLSCLKLVPEGVGKGRPPGQLCAGIQLPNPIAFHIYQEGGKLTIIVVLQLQADLPHLL